ncbi:MAG: hypothetical protein H6838_18220 [Planctomycetes bacterium]|nr:hypothetical protein [Planctomycetota bacterium]
MSDDPLPPLRQLLNVVLMVGMPAAAGALAGGVVFLLVDACSATGLEELPFAWIEPMTRCAGLGGLVGACLGARGAQRYVHLVREHREGRRSR